MKSWIGLTSLAVGGALCLTTPSVVANGGGGSSMPSNFPSSSAPQYDVNVEFAKGKAALQAGDYKEADKAFGHVLKMTPRDANSNFLNGLAEVGLGKLKDARRHFDKAIMYDENLILAYRELGLVLVKLGETEDAKAVLANLKQRGAACADACPQAADLKAAVPAIEAALGIQAPTPAAVPAPAPAPTPEPTTLLSASSELLFASAESGDRAYLDAVSLINEKRYEQAIVALKNSARAFGPHPDILTYLGFANRKLGRFELAESYYRQALALAPNHLGATEYFGELMVERGDIAGARRMLAKLENACSFGCAQADELRRWIAAAKPDAP
jgi:tetratricopeptide (TPR) repeat protein